MTKEKKFANGLFKMQRKHVRNLLVAKFEQKLCIQRKDVS